MTSVWTKNPPGHRPNANTALLQPLPPPDKTHFLLSASLSEGGGEFSRAHLPAMSSMPSGWASNHVISVTITKEWMWFITGIRLDPLREDTESVHTLMSRVGIKQVVQVLWTLLLFFSGKMCSFQFVKFLQSSDEMETNTGNRLLKFGPDSSEDYTFLTHNHDVVVQI